MKNHKIQWLNLPGYKGETWNPIVGCSKVSPGCDNCYAEFVCSMGDLFHESTSFKEIDAVFSIMDECYQHIYILLTKRPERMLEFYNWKSSFGIPWIPSDNVWMGVSAENQKTAEQRIPWLLKVQSAVRFVSIEPMLSTIDLTHLEAEMAGHLDMFFINSLSGKHDDMGRPCLPVNKLSWVICGGESGHNARPMHPDWVRSLRDQCEASGVPFFFKQWGEWMPTSRPLTSSEIRVLPEYYASTGKFIQITDPYAEYYKAGKHKSGNKIDGQQWEQYPESSIKHQASRIQ